jgi:hypothetical protein
MLASWAGRNVDASIPPPPLLFEHASVVASEAASKKSLGRMPPAYLVRRTGGEGRRTPLRG